jgi:hypothetical protein
LRPRRRSATNGYFSHGFGTASKGMAGAGVALPLDSMAPATNPAAIVFVDPGWDIGVGLFSPDREYNMSGQPSGFPGTFGLAPGAVRSGSRLFPIPHGGVVWKAGAQRRVRRRDLRKRWHEHELRRADLRSRPHRRRPLADVRRPDLCRAARRRGTPSA